jgi:hypothetical protein
MHAKIEEEGEYAGESQVPLFVILVYYLDEE